jgi:hypothetical protein
MELSSRGSTFPTSQCLRRTASEFELSAETLSPDGNLISLRVASAGKLAIP